MPTRFDVVGIGNALVDVIAPAEDHFLERRDDLVKGAMTLIGTRTGRRAVRRTRTGGGDKWRFGGQHRRRRGQPQRAAAYIGKVNGDDLGDVFGHDMRAVGGHVHRPPGDHGTPTGRCVIVVTPDAERTMNTYLGVSSGFSSTTSTRT